MPVPDRTLHRACAVLLGLAFPAAAPGADAELEALRRELAALQARLAELEALRERVAELEARLARAEAPGDPLAAKEAVSEPGVDAGEAALTWTGALRFNYFWRDFDDAQDSKRGDAGLDLFRIGVEGRRDNLLLSAEYRFYPYMDTIHHGWIGYDFGDRGQLQAGITQVPFGLLPYASHNFWFGVPYYIGLADDYDLGVKYLREDGPWNLQLAFFKNAELGNAADLERYSYDVVSVAGSRNEEANTVAARLTRTLGDGECTHELGVSALGGELYNADTDDTGSRWAAAGHLDSRCGRWNVQRELGRYAYEPRNPGGIAEDVITLGAFAASHEIAAEGSFGVFNVAYNVPVRWPRVDLLTCYNDFSVLTKTGTGFDDSYLNTTGCGIGIGPTFSYVDVIRGRNMVFFGDGSLAGGGSDDWDTRFNVNIGYYW